MSARLVVGLAVLITTTPARAENYVCRPTQTAVCSAQSGCKVTPPDDNDVLTVDYVDGAKQAIVKRCVACMPAIYDLQENSRFVQAIRSSPQGIEQATQALTTMFGLDKPSLVYTFTDALVQASLAQAGYCRKR